MNLFNPTGDDPYRQPIDRKKLLLVIGLGIGVAIGIALFFMIFFSSSNKDDFQRVVARTQELQTLTDGSQKRVRSAELAKVNSDATLLLSSDATILTTQLQKKFGEKTLSQDIKKAVTDNTIANRLTQAELLNKFDITYRNVLLEKLNQLIPLAEASRKNNGGREFTTIMDTFVKNLKAIRSQLEELNLS